MYTYTQRYKHVCINECMCTYIGSSKSWCAGTRGLIFFLLRARALSLSLSLSLFLSLFSRTVFSMPLSVRLSLSLHEVHSSVSSCPVVSPHFSVSSCPVVSPHSSVSSCSVVSPTRAYTYTHAHAHTHLRNMICPSFPARFFFRFTAGTSAFALIFTTQHFTTSVTEIESFRHCIC